MAARQERLFLAIKTEGAILPTDLLQQIVEADSELGGLTPGAYHLAGGEKLTEATSRSWNRLLGAWKTFQTNREKLAASDPATKLTREQWLLPLFQELAYGRLLAGKGIEIEGKSYAISHLWNRTPIHLLGCSVDLDRPTPGLPGAARSSPHSLLQELLNRSPNHLWGFVSNGLRLRILRDNASLARQAYVEFDLEAMMQGEVYSDFVLLWLLCHESRVEAERPEECWLEKWSQSAKQRGVRALDQLRQGVETAIKALGAGFLTWPGNHDLRERLRRGELAAQDYYRQVLRLVYRLLFLFAAEDRDLLLLPGEAHAAARERYLRFYSTRRLRRLAGRRTGTAHPDLYAALRVVMRKLSGDAGYPDLALPALGSFLFSDRALPDVENCDIANRDLLNAVRALAITVMNGVWRSVDYKNLGAEELGSVYESLLELHPRLDLDAATFNLDIAAGHERKTTGSYYTPTSLVECLLDSALNPVLDATQQSRDRQGADRTQQNPDRQGGVGLDAESAILNLKIVDPACGSGHFLIAAAHRIAKRLASVRTGDEEPSPEAIGSARRDVIGHCIYGVDVNPMAVELCKVNLWLEALEPGKPLSFLEHRIQVGNSLLGTTPRLLDIGIPDEAFKPIEGDLKDACTKWRKVNKSEREAQEIGAAKFSFEDYPWLKLGNFAQSLTRLDNLGDDTIEGVRAKAKLWEEAVRSGDYLDGKLLADAWCAAFVWKKDSLTDFPITEEVFRRIERNPHACEPRVRQEVRRLASEYNFFHWHLTFPDAFRMPAKGETPENEHAGWSGGFDVVLGNPPWERIKLQEKEWFASRHPGIANAPNAAARGRMIQALKETDPALLAAFHEALRTADGESVLVRNTGRYPLCGVGDINTYAIFAETAAEIVGSAGRIGIIVPDTIATNQTTSVFFGYLVESHRLHSLFGFKNERFLFSGIEHTVTFGLLTMGGKLATTQTMEFCWLAWTIEEMNDPSRRITLTAEDLKLINPNTRTCPIFRSARDAEITKAIYRRVPVLVNEAKKENPWGVSFMRMLDMSNDSHLFRTKEQLVGAGWSLSGNIFSRGGERYLPLYEAKMMHQFTHRYGDYAMKDSDNKGSELPRIPSARLADPDYVVQPRYWVPGAEVNKVLKGRKWLLGFRDIARSTDERTALFSVLPPVGVGHKAPLLFCNGSDNMLACLNSFVFDYVARQGVGGTSLGYFIFKQLAVLPPEEYTTDHKAFIRPRVLELTFTAYDVRGFAEHLCYIGEPFRWDDDRRFLMRCELDALYFHLYGISRDDASYILDTFPIVRRKDEQQYGEYRTKRVILEIYDAMAEAERSGIPYQTRLDPPPADPRVTHAGELAVRSR